MENKVITESIIKEAIDKVLNEQMSKVSRQEFNRVQFKIEELQNSLNETMKELRKLEDSIPNGLKNTSNSRISGINNSLSNAKKLLTQLNDKIKQYKKSIYSQSLDEKKK